MRTGTNGAVGRGVVLLGLLVLAGGCGKKPAPAPVPFVGQVLTTEKKPVGGLVLTLHPGEERNRSNQPSVFLKEGRFEGTCLPGRYKVTLAPLPAQGGAGPAGGEDATAGKAPGTSTMPNVPAKYRDAQHSPWEVTIPDEGKKDLVLTLEKN
jgi:hypothetical protein